MGVETFRPVPKPVRDNTDYQERAIGVAGKIACMNGKCAVCRRMGEIYAHHIVHRKYGNTCALVKNLLPVCVPCHARIHANETGFKEWLEKTRPGLYDRLWNIAREICSLIWMDAYEGLLIEYKGILEEKVKNEARQN